MRNFQWLLLIIPFLCFSQGRKYSNEFLSIGVDARAFGMGNAVVANQANVNSVYWNPAGLSQIYDKQFAAMHAEYFESIAMYDYLAAAFPLRNNSTIGFSVYRFGVDDILNTTDLIDSQGNIDYDKISTFSTADYAGVISYAGSFFNDPDLSLGINAKIIYRHVGKFAKGFGFGFDVGLRYETQDDFYFGLMGRDLTTTFNVWSVNEKELNKIEVEGETLNNPPEETLELTLPKIQAGVGKRLEFGENFTALPEVNINFDFGEQSELISSRVLSFSPSAGLELGYQDIVFLRGGLNNLQYEKDFNGKRKYTIQPNIGVGVKFRGFSLDYAITDIGDSSVALYSNIFSLKIDFDEFR